MKYKNYYEILNVTRKSSIQDIKLSYRKLAKKYHPDTNKSAEAESMFKDINEAYATLTNEEKRKKYDRQVARYGYGFSENDYSLSNVTYEIKSGVAVINDLFTTILGFKKDDNTTFVKNENEEKKNAKGQKIIKGSDIITHLDVSIEEGFFGIEKKIAIKSFGSGLQTFSVKVPVGIQNGDKIRLAALGNPGKNGGKNGDLIIHVKLQSLDGFKLNGLNLEKEITVTPAVAATGGKVKINLFDEKIIVTLPKHLKNGEIVNVPEKGYINEETKRGDLILKVNIDLPDDISEREEKLYEQILKLEKRRISE